MLKSIISGLLILGSVTKSAISLDEAIDRLNGKRRLLVDQEEDFLEYMNAGLEDLPELSKKGLILTENADLSGFNNKSSIDFVVYQTTSKELPAPISRSKTRIIDITSGHGITVDPTINNLAVDGEAIAFFDSDKKVLQEPAFDLANIFYVVTNPGDSAFYSKGKVPTTLALELQKKGFNGANSEVKFLGTPEEIEANKYGADANGLDYFKPQVVSSEELKKEATFKKLKKRIKELDRKNKDYFRIIFEFNNYIRMLLALQPNNNLDNYPQIRNKRDINVNLNIIGGIVKNTEQQIKQDIEDQKKLIEALRRQIQALLEQIEENNKLLEDCFGKNDELRKRRADLINFVKKLEKEIKDSSDIIVEKENEIIKHRQKEEARRIAAEKELEDEGNKLLEVDSDDD